ncbi:MAG: hypothetical protein MZV64_36680 [Ignavibacteriales bacterium]|nr:hypothetical protein [Ignavibacteriales bacterium]
MYLNVAKLLTNNIKGKEIETSPLSIKKISKIIIHPFAGWKAKEWNLNKFIKLAQKLSKTRPVSFLIPFNSLKKDIEEEIKNYNINLVETKSFEEIMLHLKIALF